MDDHNKILGRHIRNLRVRREMSQELLAERAGLSIQYVGSIERGVANPTVTCLAGIAGALNVSMVELFEIEHLGLEPAALKNRISSFLDKANEHRLKQVYKVLATLLE